MNTTNLAVAAPTYANTAPVSHNPFEALLKSGRNFLSLDLSNASLLDVLDAYEKHKRKTRSSFTNSSLRTNIQKLEEMYSCVIMPYHVCTEFYHYFKKYLLGRNLRPSTITCYFDSLRAALKFGGEHNAPLSETYKCYNVEYYERTKIALSPSQLAHIYYFEIDKNHDKIKDVLKDFPVRGFSFANLKRVQDQFILESNTAQRYSDAHRINRSCFDDTGTVYRTIQQKTGSHARVNIIDHAIDKDITLEILKRYDYTSPAENIDINNFNRLLHVLCQAIGGEFMRDIKTENKIDGEIVTENCKMWQLITSHTARRTFITYHILKGDLTLPEIQKCSGHKDLRQISKYTVLD